MTQLIRDKKILQEAVRGDKFFWEIGKKYKMSKQRVGQIVRSFGHYVPIYNPKLAKYDRWCKKVSLGNRGVRKVHKKNWQKVHSLNMGKSKTV